MSHGLRKVDLFFLNNLGRAPTPKSTKQWSDEMFENDFKVPNKVAARSDVPSAVAFCKAALNIWVGNGAKIDPDMFLGIFSAMKMGTQEDAPSMFPDSLYDPTCPPLRPAVNAQEKTDFPNYTLSAKFSLENLNFWYRKLWSMLDSWDMKLKQLTFNYVGFLLLIVMRAVNQKPQNVGKYIEYTATSEFGNFWPNTNIRIRTPAPNSSFINVISYFSIQSEDFTRVMSHVVAAYTVSPGIARNVLQSACLNTFHGTDMGGLRWLLAASTAHQVDPQTLRSYMKEVTKNVDYDICDDTFDDIFNNQIPAGQMTFPWARTFSDEVFKELKTEYNRNYAFIMMVVATNGDEDKMNIPSLSKITGFGREQLISVGKEILGKLKK